jgi:hypothetical protein
MDGLLWNLDSLGTWLLTWHSGFKSADQDSRSKLWRGHRGGMEIGGLMVTCRSLWEEGRPKRPKDEIITADGKNRRRGGCSYGCARLCTFGIQIAAIILCNMESFELMQETGQKKTSKTIHKLEVKSRTRIRLMRLLGDLGRRSCWLGADIVTGPKYLWGADFGGDGIVFGGALLSRMQLPDVLSGSRFRKASYAEWPPLPTYGDLFFSLIRNYKLLTAGCFSLNSFDMSLSSSRVLPYLLKRSLASTSSRRAPAFFHTSAIMSSSASIAPAPAANIVQSNPPAVSSRQS